MTELIHNTIRIKEIKDLVDLISDQSLFGVSTDHLNKNIYKTTTDNIYKIIGYNKPVFQVHTYGKIRSMILNSANQIVCYSPGKSIPSTYFMNKYPVNETETENSNSIIAEEFVEGTMINVFWDSEINKWEYATRNTVGAEVYFYVNPQKQQHNSFTEKTFRTMFLEAAAVNNLSIKTLDKEFCYSFVLQHPQNRIVVPFTKMQLYLIAAYKIDNDSQIIYPQDREKIKGFPFLSNTTVRFPQQYSFSNYEELNQHVCMNTPYTTVGVMIHNLQTGDRCHLRNPVYEHVRNLRGNQPNLQFQYLSLRKTGKVSEFLKYYPEHKQDFNSFRDWLHMYTNALFQNYISCYIKKEKPLSEFPIEYRTNMFYIHKMYLEKLKLENSYVSSRVVIDFMNSLPVTTQMFVLNYNVQQRYNDFINM